MVHELLLQGLCIIKILGELKMLHQPTYQFAGTSVNSMGFLNSAYTVVRASDNQILKLAIRV